MPKPKTISLLDRAMGKYARPGQPGGMAHSLIIDASVVNPIPGGNPRSETEIHGGRHVSGIVRDASDTFAREEGDDFSWDDPETWQYPPEAVSSSNLAMVAYDAPHRLMQVTFHSGAIYNYRTIPESEYLALMRAPSKGRYHYHRIRCSFPYEEITRLAKSRDCGNRRSFALNRAGQNTRQRWTHT